MQRNGYDSTGNLVSSKNFKKKTSGNKTKKKKKKSKAKTVSKLTEDQASELIDPELEANTGPQSKINFLTFLGCYVYIKCLVEAELSIQIVGHIDGEETTLLNMFSKFSKDGENVLTFEPEQLKNLKEFKLIIQNANDDYPEETEVDCNFLSIPYFSNPLFSFY